MGFHATDVGEDLGLDSSTSGYAEALIAGHDS